MKEAKHTYPLRYQINKRIGMHLIYLTISLFQYTSVVSYSEEKRIPMFPGCSDESANRSTIADIKMSHMKQEVNELFFILRSLKL